MMKKLSWCLVSFAMLCGINLSAADNPLEQVSQDADVVIRVKAFDTTIEHVAALANAVQPGTGDLVSQNATAFGLVLSNPAMAGVDQSKDFYLFLFVRDEGEPKVLFAIPTTDGAALQEGLPKNFVSEVRENWVFYADADHGIPEAASASDSLATALKDSVALELLNDSDISIHLNVEHISEIYDDKIQEGRRKLEEQLADGINTPGVANAAGAVEVLKAEAEIGFQILNDMQTLTVGITASEDGLEIEDYIDFEEGSEVAKFLSDHPKSSFQSLSRLQGDLPVYVGFSADFPKVMKLAQELTASLYTDEAMKKGMADYLATLQKSPIHSAVMSFDLTGGENGLFQATTVVDTKSSSELISAARSMATAMKSIQIGGVQQETTLEQEAETIGTRKVDVLTVTQKLDPSQPGAEMQAKISQIMFGASGMQSRIVALADGLLQVQGGGKPAMEVAMKDYDANSTSLTEERDGLDEEANLLVLLDLPGLVKNGLLAATSVPDVPVPFSKSAIEELDIASSYIGSTTVIEDHGVSIETQIPTEQFQGMMKLVMFIQTQRR